MVKRRTKAQREEEQFAALWQRVADIAAGARGMIVGDEDDWLGPDEMSRAMPAAMEVFNIPKGHYLVSLHSLDAWSSVRGITERLFEAEIRANKPLPDPDPVEEGSS